MEGWKKKSSQELPSLQEERVEVMNELEEIEAGMRRQESKRKGDNIKERRSKKRKYSRLTGWGEPEMVSTLQEDWMTRESEDLMTRKQTNVPREMTKERINDENDKMLAKPSIRKIKISEKVRKKKFEFKKKGKLNKEEVEPTKTSLTG
jgi:hypothetical protein